MSRIIHIAGNSGAGKTVLALNLGIALTQIGKDVILVDANIYSPDIGNYSDISPSIFLNEFLDGDRNIEEAITLHPSGMKMISSMAEEIHDPDKHNKINQALLSLIGKGEIILVDSFSHNPAMFSAINNADDTIFVMNDDFPSVLRSKEFINKMEGSGMNVIGIVVNKRRKSTQSKHIESIIGKPILAEIPYDEKLIDSINERQPVFLKHPDSHMSKAVRGLAELIGI